jgi:anti-sigma B factor antagonist
LFDLQGEAARQPAHRNRGENDVLLDIQKKRIGADIVVLELVGRITQGNLSQQVEWAVDSVINDNEKKVIFDLSRLERIDSTGIGILVMCSSKLTHAGGELRVAGAQGLVEQVLKLTNLQKILALDPTPEAAAEKFASGNAFSQPT